MKKERLKGNERASAASVAATATNRFKINKKPKNKQTLTLNKAQDFQLASRIIKYMQEEEKF